MHQRTIVDVQNHLIPLDMIDELGLAEKSRDRILGLNAKELFGLPDPVR
jgi:predicted TIM-barrel fold metal-dependent hydrolase